MLAILLKDGSFDLDTTIAIASLIFTAISVVLTVKYLKRIRKFKKRIDNDEAVDDFIKFIQKNETKNRIFLLDISLEEHHVENFNEDFTISFILEANEDGIPLVGVQVIFDNNGLEHANIDMRSYSNRIKGHFKVTHTSGPHMGWFTYRLKCVRTEDL